MNSQMLAKTTGRVFRAARKHYRYNQVKLAELLKINQSTVSRFERGQLLPDHYTWGTFCKHFKIPFDAYECGHFEAHNFQDKSGLKVANTHLKGNLTTVKSCLPLIHFTETKLGEDYLNSYLKEIKIDPDYFAVTNNPISEQFKINLIDELSNHMDIDNKSFFLENNGDNHFVSKANSSMQM